jgi:hypothetical protein
MLMRHRDCFSLLLIKNTSPDSNPGLTFFLLQIEQVFPLMHNALAMLSCLHDLEDRFSETKGLASMTNKINCHRYRNLNFDDNFDDTTVVIVLYKLYRLTVETRLLIQFDAKQ